MLNCLLSIIIYSIDYYKKVKTLLSHICFILGSLQQTHSSCTAYSMDYMTLAHIFIFHSNPICSQDKMFMKHSVARTLESEIISTRYIFEHDFPVVHGKIMSSACVPT